MYYNEDDNDDNIIEDRGNKTNNTNLDLNVSISSEFSNAYSDIEKLDGNDSIIDDDESEVILHESNLKNYNNVTYNIHKKSSSFRIIEANVNSLKGKKK